jgi:hypothetical protein
VSPVSSVVKSSAESATVVTSRGFSVSRNSRVCSSSNFLSLDSITRKKRLRLASAKRGTLNTGWYGCGRPLSASMPSTAASDAARIVHSNVTGMNAGQLLNGRPPMFTGYAIAEIQYCSENPPMQPNRPPMRTMSGSRDGSCEPSASCSSSIGNGE